MLLTYFLNDFEMVPVAPIITGITLVFTFHMRCISIVRSLYFRILYYYYYYYYVKIWNNVPNAIDISVVISTKKTLRYIVWLLNKETSFKTLSC
jgi:hypothetical protein